MIHHFVMVRQMNDALERLREDAVAIERRIGEDAAHQLRSAIQDMEQALLVSLDMEVGREAAREGTGLSDRTLRRRPHTGEGAKSRWKLKVLIDHYVTDGEECGEDDSGDQEDQPDSERRDPSDAVDAAVRHVS